MHFYLHWNMSGHKHISNALLPLLKCFFCMHITFVFFIFNVKFNENILEVLYCAKNYVYIIMSMNSKLNANLYEREINYKFTSSEPRRRKTKSSNSSQSLSCWTSILLIISVFSWTIRHFFTRSRTHHDTCRFTWRVIYLRLEFLKH